MNKEQGFLLVMLIVSAAVSLLFLLPFLQYVLLAVIVAYVLYPVHLRLEPHLGPRWGSILTIIAGSMVLLIPVAYITMILVNDLMALSRGGTDLDTAEIEAGIADLTGEQVDISDSLSTVGTRTLDLLFGDVTGFLSLGMSVAIGLTLMVFLIYYLLKDGDEFVDWFIEVAPMGNSVCTRMFQRIDRTAWGVIVGHIFVAVAQGVVGGVGLLIAGIPNPVFWTFVMVVMALLPLIGAFIVWAPAAAYLVVVGRPEWGVFLFLYGAIVVGLIDNVARPIIIDREAHLNPGVILIGVFGGVYSIGMTGLFIGPIVLAVFAATVGAFNEEFDDLGDPATH